MSIYLFLRCNRIVRIVMRISLKGAKDLFIAGSICFVMAKWSGIMKNKLKFISVAIVSCLLTIVGVVFSGKTVQADALSSPSLKCYNYGVEMIVKEDRSIQVKESIDVEFLKTGFTMFYKSLPKVDCQYMDIVAECEGNNAFSYYVEDNPDLSEYIDICCVGNAGKGNRWTYDISYVMTPSVDLMQDGMILDVVGAGSPFELNNVSVKITFPERPIDYQVYSGSLGSFGNTGVAENWSSDGKTLTLTAGNLPLVYNEQYGEWMAQSVTLEFSLEQGVLSSFLGSQLISRRTWVVFVFGVAGLVLSILCMQRGRNRREIIPIVNVKPPQDMDPLRIGKLIDGAVDGEDVTSMIYYFASKGYLTVDLTNEDDPVLHRTTVQKDGRIEVRELPEDTPIYQKTLFEGLFERGNSVAISELENEYYKTVEKATFQVSIKDVKRYDGKSSAFAWLSSLIAVLVMIAAPFLSSVLYVGGGYRSLLGGLACIPALLMHLFFIGIRDNEFKRGKTWKLLRACVLIVQLVCAVIWLFAIDIQGLNVAEKGYLYFFFIATQIPAYYTISRTEEYVAILGDLIGFKDFIVVTEEEKIKVMLEENPELYYDILPYAQVLGVTDAWEEKFKDILMEPPTWVTGNYTTFDYYVMTRTMRTASVAMHSRPQETNSSVGRSGGGGGFGGFSGGGVGGGGFGAR